MVSFLGTRCRQPVSLLRVSGIPARYVHVTIEVPTKRFRSWAGGFESTDAAVDFAASGGIPTAAPLSGGKLPDVQLEHISPFKVSFHPLSNLAVDT